MWFLGILMYMLAGALLYDVPFFRFLSAFLLISIGTIFGMLSDV